MSAQDGILHPIRSLSTALSSFFRPVHRRGARPETGRRIPRLEPLEDRRMLSLTLFVDADAVFPVAGDGLSWGTAYRDLQSALDQAAVYNSDASAENNVGAIWIAEGTYSPTAQLESGDVRSAAFSLPTGVTLYGGFAGTEATLEDRAADMTLHETILSGDIGVAEDATDNAYTVVYCGEGIEAGLDGLTVTRGNANGSGYVSSHAERIHGGGIYGDGAILSIVNSTIRENAATYSGGGIYSDYGTLDLSDSSILDNSVLVRGGGIAVYDGTTTITRSSIVRNSSGMGGGIYCSCDVLEIRCSTLSNNSATDEGGAIYSDHSSSFEGLEAVTIANSTVSGNSADTGAGIDAVGATTLALTGTTITGNTALSCGGGVHLDSRNSTATFRNTILAANTASAAPDLMGGGALRGTHNLIGDGSGQSSFVDGENGNIVGTRNEPIDPLLGPLGDNGGPTWTHLVLPGSPALDAGNDASTASYLDQRGMARFNGTVDMGAVEDQPSGLAVPLPDGVDLVIGSEATFAPTANDFVPLGYTAEAQIVERPAHGDVSIGPDGTWTYTPNGGFVGRDRLTYRLDTGIEPLSREATVYFSVLPSGDCMLVDTPVDEADEDYSEGDFSLREAILTAADGDLIVFSAALLDEPILLNAELGTLVLTKDVTIHGDSEVPILIDGDGECGVFSINFGVTATLFGLFLTGGYASAAVDNAGVLTVNNSILSDNDTSAIRNTGTLTVTDSTFSGNAAYCGGAIQNRSGKVSVTRSTFFGNSSARYGGGGAIYNSEGKLFISNCTLAGNSTEGKSGGILSTVRMNFGGWSEVTIFNSIVAGNEEGDVYVYNTSLFGSNNLIGDGSGQSFFVDGENGNIVGTAAEPVDPMLGPLADNGGPTWTHAPLPESPAIDAGDDARAPAFLDQRGWGRFRGTVDIGAVEAQPAGIAGAVFDGLDLAIDTQVTFDPLENDFVPNGYAATLNITGETAHGELSPNPDGTFTYTPQPGFTGDDCCTYTLDTGGGRVSNEATILFRVLPTGNPLIVDTLLDELDGDISEGDLSLREALAATDAGRAVYFSAALAGGSILLDSELGELLVSRDVDVAGFVTHPVIINAHGKSRVLQVEDGTTVSLMGLVLTGGYAPNSTGGHFGGGILSYGALTLSHMRVSDNSSTGDGGGIYSESGLLEIANSVIANNRSAGQYGGGVYSRSGTLTVTDSTIANNEASYGGGGICCAGYIEAPSTVTLTNSAFVGNEAWRSGGGLLSSGYNGTGVITTTNGCVFEGNSASYGGGIDNGGTLTLVNSLVFGNSATRWGGGLRLQPGSVNTIANSTVTANSGRDGGGVYSQGETTVANSIFAGNESEEGSETSFELTPESGHNLIGFDPGFVRNPSPGADEIWGTEDDDRGDLRLKPNSPAINAGENGSVPEGLTEDFGGTPRIADGRVDIGAFEFQSTIAPGRETPSPVVTTAEDVVDIYDGAVSLREALYYHAIGGLSSDTITFAPELEGLTLALAGEELHLDGSVHVDASMLSSFTVDAGGTTRVFNVPNRGSEASLSNLVITGGAANPGGGVFNAGTLELANVLLTGNSADHSSGGAVLNTGSLVVTNTTIADNTAYSGGAIYNLLGSLKICNSIIWQNGEDPIHSDEIVASNNLIGIDPRFVDSAAGDYRPAPGSPAVDTGDNARAVDALGRPLTSDLSGGARIVGGTVDIGAYEFTPPGPGDLNADGLVNSTDLDIVRANWCSAVPPGSLMEGDASGDGSVNSADLDIVRANWGIEAPPAAAHVKARPAIRAGIRAKAASDAVFATLYGPTRREDSQERGSEKEPETLRMMAEAAWIWNKEGRP